MANSPKRRSKSTTSRSRPNSKSPATKPRQAARRKTSNISPTRKRTSNRLQWNGLSRDRKLDIVGIVISLVGFLSLISLFSRQGSLAGWWSGLLTVSAGWGAFLIPPALLLLGLWLVFSHTRKLPVLTVERLIGVLLLFFNLLVWLSLISSAITSVDSAAAGGGLIGAWLYQMLVRALGLAAAVVALIAWLLIGITLALDLSLADLFRTISPVITKTSRALAQEWDRWQKQRTSQEPYRMIPPEPVEKLPDSFQPLKNLSGAKAPTAETRDQSPARRKMQPAAEQDDTPVGVPQIVHNRARSAWNLPEAKDILDPATPVAIQESVDTEIATLIEDTLASFGAPGHVVDIKRGPTITQYGVEPDFLETRHGRTRVRVAKITSLADDLALALAAPRIRIQAPVPGKNYVGIEVPNPETSRVTLMEVTESAPFKRVRSALRFALGKDVSGKPVAVDLARLPHLLIAGTTGSGKSVCVNSILSSLLLYNTPAELRLVLVDPKRVELTGYNGIPHLLDTVVTDAEKVINALQWMTREMDSRYHKFSKVSVRNIEEYNTRFPEKSLPYLVVVIDELADLMMLAPDETERAITRLAQLARATGIHLVLATQRPSTDVVTGLIKANFPARIAFAVASNVDSRVILDQPGAERLLGRGDMLYQAPDASGPVRLQGVFVSENETRRLVEYWQQEAARHPNGESPQTQRVGDDLPRGIELQQNALFEESPEDIDPVYSEAVDMVRREGRASITMLQRRMRIGYTRAARLIDEMEEKGIISPKLPNTQTRDVLDYGPAAPPEDNGI